MSSIREKLKKGIRDPRVFCFNILKLKISRILPDRIQVSLLYRLHMGRRLNLKNPTSFNEKLQWLKLYNRDPAYTNLADKYAVREYVKNTIGEEYLVPLLGVYAKPEDIDYAKLPNQFVIKPTHTSGDIIICRNKESIDIEETNKTIAKWLEREYFWYQREWPYKNIHPRIVIEGLIDTDDNQRPRDYKILCFHGAPRLAYVVSDLGTATKIDFFDTDWNKVEIQQECPNSNYHHKKPEQWELMLQLAGKLSFGIPQVRVDFYVDKKGDILFGELTFYNYSGFARFYPDSVDYQLGSWITLPAPLS